MEVQFSAWKKELETQLSDYDNANQLLSNRDFFSQEEAETIADELRNNPDFCEVVTGVFEVKEDGDVFYQIRGKKSFLKLRGLTKLVSNPRATYGYQTDPENNVLVGATVVESEWTDGGESSDWYIVDRNSIKTY